MMRLILYVITLLNYPTKYYDEKLFSVSLSINDDMSSYQQNHQDNIF
jgi:hypothetical protein